MEEVRRSAKYRDVCDAAVRSIGARELAARRNHKEAVKAAKNKLHQVSAAYAPVRTQYPEWLASLAEARHSNDSERLREACAQVMRHHASTRERLPTLPEFYARAFAGLPPIRRVLDVACGFNPLALPWMSLAPDATYTALDLSHDLAGFLNGFFGIMGIQGEARAADVLSDSPEEEADLALLLKALPPFEQLRKGSSLPLLRAISAPYLLVSFPGASLGGREKGMREQYETGFRALIRDEGWPVERFEFPTELCFRVKKT